MKKNCIKVINNESGDWSVLTVNGKTYYEGHDIPVHIWFEVLKMFNFDTNVLEISDEDMEEGNLPL